MKNNLSFIYLLAILQAAIVGLSFLFTKVALHFATPMDTLAYRFSIAFIAIIIIILLFKRSILSKLINVSKNSLLFLILLALFYPTLFFSLQAFGLLFSSSAEGGIIMAFAPIVTTAFAAIFLKEKTTITQTIFIFLSIFGVLYIFLMKDHSFKMANVLGFSLLFLSVLSIAGYTILARYLAVDFDALTLSFIMVSFGFIFFNIYSFFHHIIIGDFFEYIRLSTNSTFMLSTAYLGLFATLFSSFLANYILSKIQASQMSVFANLATVISIITGAVFLNEQIHFYHLLGTILIIIGVIGTNHFKKERLIATAHKHSNQKMNR